MNSFVVVFISALVAIVSCEINPEDNKTFMEMKAKCIAETGATDQMVTDAFRGVFTDSPEFVQYLLCYGKLNGIMDNEGNVDRAALIKSLTLFGLDEAKVSAGVDKCVNGKGSAETVVESTKCMLNEMQK